MAKLIFRFSFLVLVLGVSSYMNQFDLQITSKFITKDKIGIITKSVRYRELLRIFEIDSLEIKRDSLRLCFFRGVMIDVHKTVVKHHHGVF